MAALVVGVLKESWALRKSSFPQAKLKHSMSHGVLGTPTCLPCLKVILPSPLSGLLACQYNHFEWKGIRDLEELLEVSTQGWQRNPLSTFSILCFLSIKITSKLVSPIISEAADSRKLA